MENKITLTIGIPFLNSYEDLEKCVRSIYESLPATGITYEICATNDGSTDDTPQKVAENFPHVRLFHNEVNRGISDSMNTIIANMRGDCLLRLDADTIVTGDAIKTQIEYMNANPQVGVIGPRMVSYNGTVQESYQVNRRRPITWFFDYAIWLKKVFLILYPSNRYKGSKSLPVAVVIGASILTRRKAIEQVKGFDTTFRVFMDDADWCYRIANCGWKIMYLPTATIIHRGGSAWGGQYIHTKPKALSNLHEFYRKHGDGVLNQLELDMAIIAGSLVSLTIAIPFVLLIPFNEKLRRVVLRSLKSFAHVFLWYFRRMLSKLL